MKRKCKKKDHTLESIILLLIVILSMYRSDIYFYVVFNIYMSNRLTFK